MGQETGQRDISDHSLIWLKSSGVTWGPKPFRVIKGWLEYKGFSLFIEMEWESFVVREKILMF